MVQDIVVFVSLDTKVTPKESLMPLILSLAEAKAYAEYSSLEALLVEYAASTPAGKAASALFAQAAITGYTPETVAVLGLATTATVTDITDALNLLRDSHDDWYYLIPAAATDVQITALAAWAAATVLSRQDIVNGLKEAEKLLVVQTATSSLAINKAQTVVCYNPDAVTTMMHAAWVGRMLGFYPVAVSWKWKALTGVDPIDIDAAALGTLLSHNVNTYVENHKRDYMREGVCADGEYIDVVIGRWQIKQSIRAGITNLMVDTDDVPYNDTGFALVAGAVISALNAAASNNIIRVLDGRPQYTVQIPHYSEATEYQIANRIMPDIKWSATLRGGVHGINIDGVLSVRLSEEEA